MMTAGSFDVTHAHLQQVLRKTFSGTACSFQSQNGNKHYWKYRQSSICAILPSRVIKLEVVGKARDFAFSEELLILKVLIVNLKKLTTDNLQSKRG